MIRQWIGAAVAFGLISGCQTLSTTTDTSRISGNFHLSVRSTIDISSLGNSGAVKCDIKEWITATVPGIRYSLVNLKNRGAANASFCKGESFAGSVKSRYMFIDYELEGVYYRTQLIQGTSYDRFPSLNHWIDLKGREDEFDPQELVDYINSFPWEFEYLEPMKGVRYWNKQAYLLWDERFKTVTWSHRNGFEKTIKESGEKVTYCSIDAEAWEKC
jgi:hypothetical protein